jgi:hypothetical protein
MILEGIVTTLNDDGTVNVAPMGPAVPELGPGEPLTSFILRPFKTAKTYANLKRHPEGVLHVTDDVLLLAEATLGRARPGFMPASTIQGQRLSDCCRYYEFRITELNDQDERTKLVAEVEHTGTVREFFGFNRAKHAVLEAAILASRVGILPALEIQGELQRLAPLVRKTGGSRDFEAYSMLEQYIWDALASSPMSAVENKRGGAGASAGMESVTT